jgi:hypothetical protein
VPTIQGHQEAGVEIIFGDNQRAAQKIKRVGQKWQKDVPVTAGA